MRSKKWNVGSSACELLQVQNIWYLLLISIWATYTKSLSFDSALPFVALHSVKGVPDIPSAAAMIRKFENKQEFCLYK